MTIVEFAGVASRKPGFVGIRELPSAVGLVVSLRHDGDAEAVLTADELDQVIAALTVARATLEE